MNIIDVCDSKIERRGHECEICSKELCPDCIEHTEYEGDYMLSYCKECWTIGERYRDEIKKHEDAIIMLQDEWENKCKKDGK